MKEKYILKGLQKQGICAESIETAPGGTAMETYFIRCGKSRFVLKLHHSWSRKRVQVLIDLLLKINSKKELVVHPLNKKAIVIGKEYGYIYKFFEGKHFQNSNIKNKLFEFGKLHGEFSRITSRIKKKPSKEDERWTSHFFEHILSEEKEALKECRGKGRYYEHLADLLGKGKLIIENCKRRKYRFGLIHGDMHAYNVFYDSKSKSSLIFDNASLGNGILATQITVPISYALTDSDKKNSKAIKEIMRGYESKFKLTKDEKKAIPDFIIVRKVGEVTYLLSQRKKGLNEKKFRNCMENSSEQLEISIRHYGALQKLFSKL